MTTKALGFFRLVSLCAAVVLSLASGLVEANPYLPCRVPPVVGSAARPNAMLIMDYSGSMQFPAYFDYDAIWSGYYDYYDRYTNRNLTSKVAYPDTNPATNYHMPYVIYDPGTQYYGPFDTDTYYVYDTTNNFFKPAPADQQWAKSYQGVADTEDGGNGTLWLTLNETPNDIQVGDIVAVYDLGNNKSLNGDGHKVVAVEGSKIKIDPNYEDLPTHEKRDPAWAWNGKADALGYRVIKRVTGNINDPRGVSGNVLNVSVTTRVDAALQALIGGRAANDTTVPNDTTNVYIQAQGCRRWVQENTNVNAEFYVRPATLASPVQTYPDNYWDGTYSSKDMFITISGRYSGQVNSNDPKITYHMEPWTFTLDKTTHVIIKVEGNWSDWSAWAAIYSNNNFTGTPLASDTSWSKVATIEADLPQGTYYLRVGPQAYSSGTYSLWSNVSLQKYTSNGLYSNAANHNGQTLTKIGAIPWARVRIQVNADQRKKNGLVQQAFPYVRFGFMYYKDDNVGCPGGDVKCDVGKILVGCDNTDLDVLIGALEGRQPDSYPWSCTVPDFTRVFPYSGTPTGEALRETYDYFTRQTNMDNANNTCFTDGIATDPYYQGAIPVPCRKSFAILISDGVWNGGVDPVTPAREMHVGVVNANTTNDLRTETVLPGDQTVEIYSILAFSQDVQGENSMKAVAMFGGFRHIDGCGTNENFPYDETGTPGSLNFTWPRNYCDPAASDCSDACGNRPYYNTKCCKEWNSVWDRNNDGTDENKGSPDNFYKANNGKELQAALAAVFAEVTSRHASASAVATVSQELREGDIIVRGVFDAADPNKVDSYLWRGHLEAFTPFEYNKEEVYSFELPCNQDRLCMDMPGTEAPCPALGRHCFDAGFVLSDESKLSTWKIFTFDQDQKKQEDFSTSNDWLTKAIDASANGVNRLGYLATDQSTQTTNLISWIRGGHDSAWNLRDRTGWETSNTKPWQLGDIVYSTPVVIGPPGLGEVSKRDPDIAKFYEHRNEWIHRMKVVYVGANDGKLHAFILGKYDSENGKWHYDPNEVGYEDLGKEIWAYIPSNLLTEFRPDSDGTGGIANVDYGNGGCVHRTMVDLAPRSWEVYINPTANRPDLTTNPCGDEADSQGRCWRSVLVGGERGGGDVYFAIDVTDPLNPIVLWEYPVLKNRVVVEAVSGDQSQCGPCQNRCDQHTHDNACWVARGDCWDLCPDCTRSRVCGWVGWQYKCWWANDCTARDECRSNCSDTYTRCIAPCLSACDALCNEYLPGAKYFVPFKNVYDSVKILPLSWSAPYLGRIEFPLGMKFYYGDPSPLDAVNGGLPYTSDTFSENNTRRSVVFMGGGIHLYDRQFDPTPPDDKWKVGLFWPYMLMMDIETGHNLFEYVWPIVVNHAAATFPLKIAGNNTIPYAMSDPLALDLWNQRSNAVGDDGFIDRVYVGDMNGYIYGIKFNMGKKTNSADPGSELIEVNGSGFGIQVDLWPTKPVEPATLDSDYYRSDRQPITLALAATFEKGSNNALRVLIGTGKYDDVDSDTNDKTDTARMSLYNLRDLIELPDLSGTDQVYQVYDSTFKVRLNSKCPNAITNSDFFNSGCTWAKVHDASDQKTTICTDPDDLSTCTQTSGVSNSPDCCEQDNGTCSNPCYKCVYDFTLPAESALPGERVVGKPLIAGGLVFLTTFVPPSDPCDWTGSGYLYAFSADCVPLLDPRKIFDGGGTAVGAISSGNGTAASGVRLGLGSGVPSRPVLDSRGEHIVVQMSDGTLQRKKVNLPGKPIQIKGWRSR